MKTVVALLAALPVVVPSMAHANAGADAAATAAPTVTPAMVESPAAPVAPLPVIQPPPAAPEGPRRRGSWYGWQLMLSDTLFLLLASDQGHETGLGSYGVPLALLGMAAVTPALHFLHDNKRRAGISLLIRGGAVGFVAFALDTIDNSRSSPDPSCVDHCAGIDITEGDVVLMGLAGIVAGGAITYVVAEYIGFSREPAPARPRATIVPTASLRPGGGGLGLAATF